VIGARLHLQRPGFTLDLDLKLPGRGVSALFGPSGCGKTTVLRALAGLERARGRVALGSTVWQDDASGTFVPTHRRALGYVIQDAALFPHLDVRRNLAFGERRVAPGARRIALPQVLALLGIEGLLARSVGTLSGGERQRVAIARALATSPELLLMDEPLSALDAARKAEILPFLERLTHELAIPIVYVTHAMDEVARLADHLVLLDAGRERAAGPLGELLARPDLFLARLPGAPDDAGVVIEAAVRAHDDAYGLLQLGFDGGTLWMAGARRPTGEHVRVRVLARDVSVTRQPPQATSILNVLPVQLDHWQTDGDTVLLKLRAGGCTALLARITRRSVDLLALQPGDTLYAQIKGVALA